MVYGKDPIFPIQLRIPTLWFMQDFMEGEDRVHTSLTQLLHLDEKRDEALEKFAKHQGVVKRWFDKMVNVKKIWILDLVLY